MPQTQTHANFETFLLTSINTGGHFSNFVPNILNLSDFSFPSHKVACVYTKIIWCVGKFKTNSAEFVADIFQAILNMWFFWKFCMPHPEIQKLKENSKMQHPTPTTIQKHSNFPNE
jgi:hypothetical protein